jgi:hypothetical protein
MDTHPLQNNPVAPITPFSRTKEELFIPNETASRRQDLPDRAPEILTGRNRTASRYHRAGIPKNGYPLLE